MTGPTSEQIRSTRLLHDLTQTEAASIIHAALRSWQQWEAGSRHMHPAFWELFCIKAAQQPAPALGEQTPG